MKNRISVRRILKKTSVLIDSIVLSAIISASVYPMIRRGNRRGNILILLILAFTITMMLRCCSYSVRIGREKRKDARNRKQERILLMSDGELERITGEKGFRLIRKREADVFDVLEEIRTGAGAIGVFGTDRSVKEAVERNAPHVRVIERAELYSLVFPDAKESGSDEIFFFFENLMVRGKYFLFGIGFLFISYIVKFKIYYRLIACFCLIIAVITAFFGNLRRQKNL
jgi:hypothetical protein